MSIPNRTVCTYCDICYSIVTSTLPVYYVITNNDCIQCRMYYVITNNTLRICQSPYVYSG